MIVGGSNNFNILLVFFVEKNHIWTKIVGLILFEYFYQHFVYHITLLPGFFFQNIYGVNVVYHSSHSTIKPIRNICLCKNKQFFSLFLYLFGVKLELKPHFRPMTCSDKTKFSTDIKPHTLTSHRHNHKHVATYSSYLHKPSS